MTRLDRVPARHYKRRLTISEHALARFRERVDEEFRHRDDEDLANLLDLRLRHPEFDREVRDPRAPNAVTRLCAIACRNATYYAVVRHATAVTLLDEDMAKNNFRGQGLPFEDPAPPLSSHPFAALRDLKIAPRPPPPPPVAASPAPPAGPATPPQATRAREQQRRCAETVAALEAALVLARAALGEADRALEELAELRPG